MSVFPERQTLETGNPSCLLVRGEAPAAAVKTLISNRGRQRCVNNVRRVDHHGKCTSHIQYGGQRWVGGAKGRRCSSRT